MSQKTSKIHNVGNKTQTQLNKQKKRGVSTGNKDATDM